MKIFVHFKINYEIIKKEIDNLLKNSFTLTNKEKEYVIKIKREGDTKKL